MILTFHPDPDQEKLINELKSMYFEKTATAAVFKAVKYAVNNQDKDRIKIAELSTQIETLNNKIEHFKTLFNKIKEYYALLSDLSSSK